MVYSSETSKWKAYQFNDPFAAGSFFVCNKINQIFCRPDCDVRPITNLKLEIKFVSNSKQALQLGYKPCEHCDPINTSMAIDVNLLIKCVSNVNTRIGFIPPLLDDDEESNSLKIKENILESKKLNQQELLNKFESSSTTNIHGHRNSVPNLISSYDNKAPKDLSLSKNDSDHYRLVDMACRHLALAAAINVFQPKPIITNDESSSQDQPNSPTSNGSGKRRRRRRGGVLGFKELAAKSKLSAWHFHRVFKSVTGLTPKTYGDKCWEFVKKVKESGEYTSFEEYSMNSPVGTTNLSDDDNSNTTSIHKNTHISNPNSPLNKSTSGIMSNTCTSSPQDVDGTTIALYPITPTSQTTNIGGTGTISNIDSAISEFPEFGFPTTNIANADSFLNFSTGLVNGDDSSTRAFSYQDMSSLRGGKQDSITNSSTGSLFNNTNNLLQYTQFQPLNQSYDPTTTTNDSYVNTYDEYSHMNDYHHQQQPQQQQQQQNHHSFDDLYSLTTFDENLFNNDTLFQVGNNSNNATTAAANDENKYNYNLMTTIGL